MATLSVVHWSTRERPTSPRNHGERNGMDDIRGNQAMGSHPSDSVTNWHRKFVSIGMP